MTGLHNTLRFSSWFRPTVTRYLIAEYLKMILLTLAGFLVLYCIVELFEIGRLLYRYKAPLGFLPKLLFLKFPVILYQMMPVAALVGTLVATGLLIKNNELVVLRISGFTYARLFLIVLVPCIAVAAANFAVGEDLVPRTTALRDKIVLHEIRRVERAAVQTVRGIWIPGIGSIFKAQELDPSSKSLIRPEIYAFDDHFNLDRYIAAERARYVKPEWVFENGILHRFKAGDLAASEPFEEIRLTFPEGFDDFEVLQEDPDTMSVGHLWTLIRKLTEQGHDATPYRVALQTRISFPSLTIPLSLLGFAIAHMGGRRKTMGGHIFLAIMASFFTWTLFGLTIILGQHGLLPAEISAWLIHIPLTLAGLVILAREL